MTGRRNAQATTGTALRQTLQLSDGRNLGYAQFGTPGQAAIFYFHGLPGSRLEPLMLTGRIRQPGVRLVAVDRPGYGLSDFRTDRRLLDCGSDIVELADHLMIDRFGLLGISGGAPFALACARQLLPRVRFAGIVCGLAPLHDKCSAGSMQWWTQLAFFLARKHPRLLDIVYGQPVSRLAATRASGLLRLLAWLNGEPDAAVLRKPEILRTLGDNVSEAFRRGPAGAETDLAILGRPWGFSLAEISVPVHIWHGSRDSVVPPQHGRRLQAELAQATLELVPGEGHFSLPVNHCARILAKLTEMSE